MTYTKPEITKLGEASVLICSGNFMQKQSGGADIHDPNKLTVPAYSTEE
jgi:hypothetical protein